jgi:tetratricopeptide (TPR) repeat protein
LVFHPGHIDARISRASVSAKLGDLAGAMADYNIVVENAPDNLLALNNHANLLAQQGQYDQALRDLSRVLDIDPNYSLALCSLAEIYIAMGEIHTGLDWLEPAIKTDSTLREYASTSPHYDAARTYPRFQALISDALDN